MTDLEKLRAAIIENERMIKVINLLLDSCYDSTGSPIKFRLHELDRKATDKKNFKSKLFP
jgi:hypothetical protein